MSSSYRNSLNQWLSQLDVTANKVLDVGGSQLPVKGRTKSWDVKEYLIADLRQPHVDSPKPDIVIDLNYPDELLTDAHPNIDKINQLQDKFDIIFCLEVFEYLFRPLEALETIRLCLSKSGSAWVTFPSFYPMHQPIEDDALRYMPGGIKKLAEASGLTIKQMTPRRPETNALTYAWGAERMRAAKGEDHNFTGWIVEFVK